MQQENQSAAERKLPPSDALAALESLVAQHLSYLELPRRDWVPQRDDPFGKGSLCDVVVVGAGVSGLAVAFGLKRQGVSRVLVIDAAPAGQEGPWVTTARMRTLRSPKTLTGPDMGIAALTYRSWHEAVFGTRSWEALDRVTRQDWMQYLIWFRQVTGIVVSNNTQLLDIAPSNDMLVLDVEDEQGPRRVACRKLVLATGIEGAGGFEVPGVIETGLPRDRWTHSAEQFDCAALNGRDIGVVGAAASAFDWAVAALEAGARSVTLLARSPQLPQTEVLEWSNFPGYLDHFADLGDDLRYRFSRQFLAFKLPPTAEMYRRAMQNPSCRLVLGAALDRAEFVDGRIVITTPLAEPFEFDHLLIATGYRLDLERRPELARLAGLVATWRDRYSPPADDADPALLAAPYLGPGFEFLQKTPGMAPWVSDIHLFNNGAVPSMGPLANGITGLKAGAPRLVAGITRSLFLKDSGLHLASLMAYNKVHFDPDSIIGRDGEAAKKADFIP